MLLSKPQDDTNIPIQPTHPAILDPSHLGRSHGGDPVNTDERNVEVNVSPMIKCYCLVSQSNHTRDIVKGSCHIAHNRRTPFCRTSSPLVVLALRKRGVRNLRIDTFRVTREIHKAQPGYVLSLKLSQHKGLLGAQLSNVLT